MKTIGQRIRFAREAAGLNQSELSRLIRVTSQAVNLWEHDKKQPGRDSLMKVAQATNAPIHWLMFGGVLPEQEANGKFIDAGSRGRFIPMLTAKAAISGHLAAPGVAHYPVHFPCGPNAYFVTLEDDSNAPDFPSGTRWAVDPDQTPIPGDMVLAAIGEPSLPAFGEFRLEASPNGNTTIIVPLNGKWPHIRSDAMPVKVLGVMTEYVRRRR